MVLVDMNVSRSDSRLCEFLKDRRIEFRTDSPLALYTSFRIGGPADVVILPRSADEAAEALNAVRECGLPLLVLGNGTNVLAADEGYRGAVVVLTGLHGIRADGTMIHAEAGVPLTVLAREAAKEALTGLEFAYGIPGTVGGGVFMNAGAYGGELASAVVSSFWYDPATGKTGRTDGDAHDFSYRHSCYMDSGRIVLSADFKLSAGDPAAIQAQMNDYMTRRREKQPLEYPSAGSVFKRGKGFITAKLIEEAGLKGRRVGGAEVSELHAGFIVNRGGATARDVYELIGIIKKEIAEKYGVSIECEVQMIGNVRG